ncbi:hypothetical protein ABZT04_33380 [Streptomyces sp. NPDC005492]|uniref:hypothetical protein n=1 Tax=Streptomyces sp. NPDC005492 TaxID=3156883 RepID=UPI0033B0D2E2
MPTRTMLPPNLTRHFYETRRAFLRSAGQESTPWFRLSPMERAVVESEMEIFRQAIGSAEEEQDLIASLDATRAAAATDKCAAEEPEPAASADEAAREDCCLECAAVAAVLTLIGGLGGDLDGTVPGVPVTLDARPISVERLLVMDSPFDDIRAEFWRRKPPITDKA